MKHIKIGVLEYWRAGVLGLFRLRRDRTHHSIAPALHHSSRPGRGFALYEVLIGVSIFLIGVVTLGRAVQNCLNASTLSAEEDRVREILGNRMAEVQTSPGLPDVSKQIKIDTGYGTVTLVQKSVPANLTEPEAGRLTNLTLVTLTAEWQRGGVNQSQVLEFYVYRPG